MKKTIAKAITAAILVSGAALASQPAMAMGFKNCTGEQIRIKIYNNRDVARIAANPFGNGTIGVNGYRDFNVGKDLKQVKVLRSRFGKDTEVLLVGGLNGGHKFSVRKVGNRYSISTQNDCGKGAGPKPGPVKTIAVDHGRWFQGKNHIDIRNVTGNSFELRRKGRKGWSRYTLVGRDRYRDSDGNTLVMASRGQADWNGVRYRKK